MWFFVQPFTSVWVLVNFGALKPKVFWVSSFVVFATDAAFWFSTPCNRIVRPVPLWSSRSGSRSHYTHVLLQYCKITLLFGLSITKDIIFVHRLSPDQVVQNIFCKYIQYTSTTTQNFTAFNITNKTTISYMHTVVLWQYCILRALITQAKLQHYFSPLLKLNSSNSFTLGTPFPFESHSFVITIFSDILSRVCWVFFWDAKD